MYALCSEEPSATMEATASGGGGVCCRESAEVSPMRESAGFDSWRGSERSVIASFQFEKVLPIDYEA